MSASERDDGTDRGVTDAPIPTVREIKKLKARAARDKETPAAGGSTVVRLPTRGAKRHKPRRSAKARHARG